VAADYRGERLPVWCAGCGDFGVLTAVFRAFSRMDLDPDRTVLVSGIGCSSRLPGFAATYGLHGAHGRALPTAMGVKLANPDLTVVAVAGDGDAYAIGAGHLPHAARRNVDITYLVIDNEVYGLTKGQASPTTPASASVFDEPAEPLAGAVAAGASWVGRGASFDGRALVDLIVEAVQHPGFALLDILSPCAVFNDTGREWREAARPLPADHDPSDRLAAFDVTTRHDGTLPLGVFYRAPRTTLESRLAEQAEALPPATVEGLLDEVRLPA
jgi:2-oxoglutarate ferredoxin oxidoreductase subunit beta